MSKTRMWGIGAVVLVLIMLIAGWELGISPTLTAITAANTQSTTIQSTNAASQAKLANLAVQFKGLNKFKKSLNKLRESIPENEGASGFLNEIAELCGSSGVTLASLSLASATVYVDPSVAAPAASADATTTPAPSAPATTPATTTPTPSAGSGLVLIPVTFVVKGSLDAVRDFVDAAQHGARLLYSSQVDFSTGTDGVTNATITGDIFALKGTSDAAPVKKVPTLPNSTPTPTATPTPTPTATTSSQRAPLPPATQPPVTSPTTDPIPDPTATP